MKSADSPLIGRFISQVKAECITGDEHTGSIVLQEIVEALQAIQEGAVTDTALQIERTKGSPSKGRNFIVAYIIRAHRKAGDKVSVAHLEANNWLIKEGYRDKPLSDKRLRDIYDQHKPQLKQRESIQLMMDKVNQHIPKKG